MDKAAAIKLAIKYLNFIKNKYDIRDAYLFGSFAKGTNQDDSDVDIAIVLNTTGDIIDAQIELMKLRRKIDLRIEPHPFYYQDFNRNDPVVNEIMNYGINIQQGQSSLSK